ncbi:methyltransferase domain-containing protein [Leptothermofonsia sichuanensis E412]|uniref:class I SAM-dependent methyltransferase n=1 Tax=Leptothermofonsia sichuanensis TaxID=2917832 RepID=UPI001CA741B0|nr:methyltransferase domain-containing protein [Leptothermofonsia sichuanensis]QZZ20244.1 methyltransferase domain-containing protein [Leptothermofonsia sichuanensis E412]
MKAWIKKTIINLLEVHTEERKLLEFISSLQLSMDQKLLDIGCGYGRKLKLISALGINSVGVEVNPTLVQKCQEAGLNCLTVDEFNKTGELYDVLLMSHIIEHFLPDQLLEFMDSYLDRLKPGGHLIIATPLGTPYFYDDFDHIKPYNPAGISMVFGGNESQVQYYARNQIHLEDIWFRREPFKLTYFAGLYVKKHLRFPILANLLLALLFRFSFGVIGQTNGWIGIYRKMTA